MNLDEKIIKRIAPDSDALTKKLQAYLGTIAEEDKASLLDFLLNNEDSLHIFRNTLLLPEEMQEVVLIYIRYLNNYRKTNPYPSSRFAQAVWHIRRRIGWVLYQPKQQE